MDIQTKKLGPNKWEMHLQESVGEYVLGTDLDMQEVRKTADEFGKHDRRVSLIHEELVKSDFTMYSRQAYDRWHWYDKTEMEKFITLFLLKHSGK